MLRSSKNIRTATLFFFKGKEQQNWPYEKPTWRDKQPCMVKCYRMVSKSFVFVMVQAGERDLEGFFLFFKDKKKMTLVWSKTPSYLGFLGGFVEP